MRIYLADLGHNQLTISSDVYPLGISNLASYTQAYSGLAEAPIVRIFREPEDLQAALNDRVPDMLGLSNYAWNHELSLCFARYAKKLAPGTLTLMGGPNFPLDPNSQEAFLRSRPEIDVVVAGRTYEGERAFVNIVRRFAEAGSSLAVLLNESVPGSVWIHRESGELVRGGQVERIRDLDEIPSPYLSGWLDPFLESGDVQAV